MLGLHQMPYSGVFQKSRYSCRHPRGFSSFSSSKAMAKVSRLFKSRYCWQGCDGILSAFKLGSVGRLPITHFSMSETVLQITVANTFTSKHQNKWHCIHKIETAPVAATGITGPSETGEEGLKGT